MMRQTLTTCEQKIAVMTVQRKLSKLHCFAHNSDVSSEMIIILRQPTSVLTTSFLDTIIIVPQIFSMKNRRKPPNKRDLRSVKRQ